MFKSNNSNDTKSGIPELNLFNFNSSGNINDNSNYQGLSFVLFWSKGCCQEEIKVFKELHSELNNINMNRQLPLKFFIYESSKGMNSAIFSGIFEHAPYRIYGFPTVVVYYNGEFCSVYKPDNLPEANKLANELINYANKVTQKSFCEVRNGPLLSGQNRRT
jgi:hypothetical protein